MTSRTRGEAGTRGGRALTTAEAARALGVTPSRVRQLIQSRRLIASRFGRDYAVSELALQHFRASPPPQRGRPRKRLAHE
jgi:excisionase family DNA binding protein